MSSGAFNIEGYESTATGQIHPIRVQPETLTLTLGGNTNDAPGGAIDSPISAQVSQGARSLGLNARMVTITWEDAAPTNYKASGTISLPWLAEAGFSELIKGVTGTYLGSDVRVVGTRPEKAN